MPPDPWSLVEVLAAEAPRSQPAEVGLNRRGRPSGYAIASEPVWPSGKALGW